MLQIFHSVRTMTNTTQMEFFRHGWDLTQNIPVVFKEEAELLEALRTTCMEYEGMDRAIWKDGEWIPMSFVASTFSALVACWVCSNLLSRLMMTWKLGRLSRTVPRIR